MAKRVSGITVEIGGDTTKLGKALGDVNKQSRGLQTELKGVNTLLKMDPTNVVLIRQKQELLNTSIDKTKDKLNVLKGAQKEVQAQFDKGEITEEQYRDFQREIEATEIKLKGLKDEAKDFDGVIGTALKNAGEKVTEFGKKTEEAGKKFAPFSAIAAAMLVGSGKAAIDFESAWAGVMKTVDGTPEQMDTIRQSILDMSGTLPASAEEISQVAENAGQLGIETQNVLSFTKTMIDMGEATNMSADTASTSLARFANITQMSQEDFSRLGSTIVNLGNNMATTEGEIVDMSLRLAGTGKQVGLSEAEIMALSATMASLGINAEAGGSSMSRIMQKINTEVLSGSETMDAFAEVSGMSGSTFAKMWESDPLAAVTAFTRGLDDISSSGGDVTTILKDLGISSTQEIDTLLRMSGATEVLTGAIDMANTGWNENIALTNEAETRYGTTESKMEMLRNKIKAVAIQIGDVLIPIIQQVVDFIGKWVDKFSTLSNGAKLFIVVLLSVISAIAPLLIVIGKIAQGVGAVITIMPTLAKAFKAAWAAATGPVGLVVIAITALVAVFIYLWNTSEEFRNFWINLWEIIKQAALDAWEWIKEAWGKAGEFFGQLWETIKQVFANTGTYLTEAWTSSIDWIKEAWQSITDFFVGIWETIKETYANTKQFFSDVWTGAIEGITAAWESTKQFFVDLWTGITEGAIAGWNYITSGIMSILEPYIITFNTIWDNISGYMANMWNSIQFIALNAWNLIKNVILAPVLMIVDMITGDFDSMGSHLSQIWDNIKFNAEMIWLGIQTFFTNLVQAILGTVTVLWNNLKNNTINIFNAVKAFLLQTWTSIKDSVIQLGTSIKDGAIAAWNALKNGVVNAANAVKNGAIAAWNNLKASVVNGANALKNGAINAWNGLKNGVINAANSLKNSAIAAWNALKSSVVNLANGIKNGAQNAWNSMVSGVRNTINSIKNIFNNLRSINLFEIGKNIIQGLINGVKNMVGAVGSAIQEVAGGIKNKIKGALGIKSPSTWMRDFIGKMIPAGIAVGVEKATPEATNAIDDMGEEIKRESNSADMINMMNGRPTFETSKQQQGIFDVSGLQRRMDEMVDVMSTYLPHLSDNTPIVLDNGALVGGTRNEMDRQLGRDKILKGRGRGG